MKAKIHPEYVEATVHCACGNEWQTKATRPQLRVEVCSHCHPFFTGEQRIVDTAGQVDRFMRRLERTADTHDQVKVQQEAQKKTTQEQRLARRRGDVG